ncbi:hypothetical protein Pan241w_15130 [Gimesia alba]|uniref:Uncharacterized protein n=1 Tax=Gimesia alba TaxID=2527973 RepID=A0A517RC47_9PLAN|nr:hypothetical protein [Gimesia alba]QDT41452.1 hypothetical protein Pan241w_15130 [Gimesia alba]
MIRILWIILALPLLLLSIAFISLVLFIITHPPGDVAIPMGPKIDLPDSHYYLHLYGPAFEGEYFYGLFAEHPFQQYESRTLGPLNIDVTTTPTVEQEADGVYRITWGSKPDAPYTVIDVIHGKYVEDSNPANERNQPFKLYHFEPPNCQKPVIQNNDQ